MKYLFWLPLAMQFPFLAISATTVNASSNDEKEQKPKSVPPIVAVAKVSEENQELSLELQVPVFRTVFKEVERLTKDPNVPGGKERVRVAEQEIQLKRILIRSDQLSLKDQKHLTQITTTTVRNIKGELVDKATVLTSLTKPSKVLLIRDNLDPFYLQVVKPDTLVINPGFFLRRNLNSTFPKLTSVEGAQLDDHPSIEKIKQEFSKVLTKNWLFEVDKRNSVFVIKSAAPVPVFFNSQGIGPLEAKEVIVFRFFVKPFVGLEDFKAIEAKRKKGLEERFAFEKQHLQKIPAGRLSKGGFHEFKSGRPAGLAPENYRPRNEAEKNLIAEYRLLWKRTEPQTMPTHYSDNMSFIYHPPFSYRQFKASFDGKGQEIKLPNFPPSPIWTILDKQMSEEYLQLEKKLNSVFKAYQ